MDIGYIALFLAAAAALYSAVAFVIGHRARNEALLQSARNGLIAVFALTSVSVSVLLYGILTHDFSNAYIASYTSTDMSLPYLVSALWAGNDGSLLFWAWLITLFAFISLLINRNKPRELVNYSSVVMMVIAAFFVILVITSANPFETLASPPAQGMGLNPLLENPGMLIHPPALLGGYVGFAVPFAFAIAALISGRLGDEWIIIIRRWTLVSWMLLGIGNLLGAWWAYVELGWGGFWAWDPVENASLLPWLVMTAFLHSIMMQRRRGMLKVWNMSLVIIAFALTIVGTFLTRSGVISSVHTFAASPLLGSLLLTLIGVILVGGFGLLYWRSGRLSSDSEMESLVSRESTFLLNNLLLVGAAFAILLGTFFPIISEAVRGVKVSVGPPFYDQVNGPIFLAIIVLAGICTLIGWRRASRKNLVRNFAWPAVAAGITGVVLFVAGVRQWYPLLSLVIFAFVLGTILYEWVRGTGARHRIRGDNYAKAFWGLIMGNRPRYGGYIVHISIILMAIGVVGSTFYETEQEAVLRPGQSTTITDYTLEFETIDTYELSDRVVVTAVMGVYRGGNFIGRLTPEKYYHRSYEQSVSEVAIRSTLVEDLYVILIDSQADGLASFKVLVNPMVKWLWIGGWVFIAGGLLAFWPERRKPPALVEESEAPASLEESKPPALVEGESRRQEDDVEEVA